MAFRIMTLSLTALSVMTFSFMILSIITLSNEHEQDCNLRESEQDGTGQNGMITEISETRLFQKISLLTIHDCKQKHVISVIHDIFTFLLSHFWSFFSHFLLKLVSIQITILFPLVCLPYISFSLVHVL